MSATLTPMSTPVISEAGPDPLAVMKELVTLRRLVGLYPTGHPLIEEKLRELDVLLQRRLEHAPSLQVDIVRGDVHIDGDAFRHESRAH
jgi:hypothetical protein